MTTEQVVTLVSPGCRTIHHVSIRPPMNLPSVIELWGKSYRREGDSNVYVDMDEAS